LWHIGISSFVLKAALSQLGWSGWGFLPGLWVSVPKLLSFAGCPIRVGARLCARWLASFAKSAQRGSWKKMVNVAAAGRRGLLVLVACSGALAASSAQAAIVIDDFSVGQGPHNQFNGWDVWTAGPMLNGGRRTYFQNASGVGSPSVEVQNNRLSMSKNGDSSAFPVISVYYNGADKQGNPAGTDLTEGGTNDRFRFDSVVANGVFLLAMQVKMTNGAFSTGYFYADSSDGVIDVLFSGFDSNKDFTKIQQVYFEFQLANYAGQNNGTSISTGTLSVVPSPSAASLMGLSALAALRRRR
jgi:hypothetical protein